MRTVNIKTYIEQRTIPEPNSGCVLWTAGTDKDGYGKIYYEGSHWRVHRLVYKLHFGELPANALVLHKCDTPACCNYFHLMLGTPLSNMQDKVQKGRLKNQHMDKTHCLRGHLFDKENTRIEKNGRRTCVQCRRDRRGITKTGPAKITHCKRGHEFTWLNTRICSLGKRHCRACAKTRQVEKSQLSKAEGP